MRNFDIAMNICTSIIVSLFLYSLVHNKRERIIYPACSFYAIIEFLYIENLSFLFGLSKGMYEFFNIILCFLFFLVASKQSILENLFLSCMPSLILMTTDLIMQFILTIQSSQTTLMEAILQNRFVIFTLTNCANILLFTLFSLLYRKIFHYIENPMYILLSVIILLCAFIMNRCEQMLQGVSDVSISLSIIPAFILLCIVLVFVFSHIIYQQAHAETVKTRLALAEETRYLNTAIREKERYFEELKHNVQLFLQLLRTNADKQEIEKKAQQLENLSDAETTIPLFQSTAFSAALYNLRRTATTLDIKTTYLCSKPFAIAEPDMYLILSALFERIAKQAEEHTTILITAEGLETNCRMTIDYQSETLELEIPETIRLTLKKYGALYTVTKDKDISTIMLLIPLEKTMQ